MTIKTPLIARLAGGLLATLFVLPLALSNAHAQRGAVRGDSVGSWVRDIRESAESASLQYRVHLERTRRWKPRGYEAKMYSTFKKLDEYGNRMVRYYNNNAKLSDIDKIARAMNERIEAIYAYARYTDLPKGVLANVRRLSASVTPLCRYCQGAYPDQRVQDRGSYRRDRYDDSRGRYDDSRGRDWRYEKPPVFVPERDRPLPPTPRRSLRGIFGL